MEFIFEYWMQSYDSYVDFEKTIYAKTEIEAREKLSTIEPRAKFIKLIK